MANVFELRLVKSRCSSMFLVYEGRTYKLKNTSKQKKYSDDKERRTMWTNLEVTAVINQKDHMESYCNGPLPRAGSSASSTGLLTRPSLFGDGPVLTAAFFFRSVSRFPDGIATTKQQAMSIYFIRQSETRIDDNVNTSTLLATCQH
ncbi:hypothetical protein T4B_9661 [Trichinella pseudospiralis]|uniref:Uncharacterized protein n=1 Tax=Trichinella pseudospiralis TaxID=6337 RepID=A0A0V1JTL1_TRIPS|nr:hypothetical protein T4A_11452 [Trichinella pseudospiralis]KRZ30250.1 hypothetical protein T4B_9661 [Trichinella pseudospiralis]KRZ38303.1 hypothetical protein T4C_5480 [Trichinella pseudospiralis]